MVSQKQPKSAQTSIFDDWSTYIVEILKSESRLAGSIVQHAGELGDAREAIIQGILLRILPSIYEIGTGEIVDNGGNHSKQIDIIIARRDFPALALPSGSKVYLVESVLATIEVKSVLNKENLTQALENCASVADLMPNVIAGARKELAKKRGLRMGKSGDYVHDDPLVTARFNLEGRPPGFIFGFSGYKGSATGMATTIGGWMDERGKTKNIAMSHLPAVIAAEGLIFWRNADPYPIPKNILGFVSEEANPLRILILQLLYTLSKKLPAIPDVNGIAPNLDIYIQQMKLDTINVKCGVGAAYNK